MLQGLAAGGEWSGSILLIHENAPADRRGALVAWSPCGAAFGFVLSTAAFLLVQQLPSADVERWGWRIPFLASIVLVGFGLWMRRSIGESAEFADARSTQRSSATPIVIYLVLLGATTVVATCIAPETHPKAMRDAARSR